MVLLGLKMVTAIRNFKMDHPLTDKATMPEV
jgi:hypothetical protein